MNYLLLLFFLIQSQVPTLIEQADNEALKNFNNKNALHILESALKIESTNPEILWRLSRTYVDIGEHLPSKTENDKNEQLKNYQLALKYSESAISNSNQNKILLSQALTRKAIALGRVALFKGVWESLDLVKNVKSCTEEAIKLDNTNSSAFYVLARTHAKICEKPKIIRIPLGLGWANRDESVSFYKKAISLRPNFIMYRLDFARVLIDLDDFSSAKIQLKKIENLPNEDEDDIIFKKEAKKLLEEI